MSESDLQSSEACDPGSDAGAVPGGSSHRPQWLAPALVGAITLLLAAIAGYFALVFASPTQVNIGPLTAEFSLSPAWHGKSIVELPPAGSFEADTHSGPAEVRYTLKEIAVEQVEELTDPGSPARQALDNWQEPVGREVRSLLLRIALLAAAAGGVIAALLRRRWQWLLAGAATGLATAFIVGGLAWNTYDTAAFQEPRYQGSLSYAPEVLAFSQETLANLGAYEDRVPEIAQSLFRTVSELHQLPPSFSEGDVIRVLHISDMHNSAAAARLAKSVTTMYGVDLVIDTGDETDLGTPLEAGYPATYLPLPKPMVWVAGNHDTPIISKTMKGIPGVTVLENSFVTLAGLEIGGFPDPASTSLSPAPSSDAVQAAEANLIAAAVEARVSRPFIVAVHDPKQAAKLPGMVPVVLNGHTHREQISVDKGTVFIDGGSTGGGGFRGIDHDGESPNTLHILFIQKQPLKLLAVDTITIYGYRQEFSVVRRVFGVGEGESTDAVSNASNTTAPVTTSFSVP